MTATECSSQLGAREAFAQFNDSAYALVPHRHPYLRWLFLHNWILPTIILILTIALSMLAVYSTEEPRAVWTLLRVYGPVYVRGNSYDISCNRASDSEMRLMVCAHTRLVKPEELVQFRRELNSDLKPSERVSIRYLDFDQNETASAAAASSDQVRINYLVAIRYTSKEWTSFVMSELTLTLAVPLLLCLVVTGSLISRLAKLTPNYLYDLTTAGRLLVKKELEIDDKETAEKSSPAAKRSLLHLLRLRPRTWDSYAMDLEYAVTDNPLRYWSFALFIVLLLSLTMNSVDNMGALQTEVIWSSIYAYFIVFFGTILSAYVISFALWELIAIAAYLHNLPAYFQISIQDKHGDGCGGLQKLGYLSLYIALIIAGPSTAIAAIWWLFPDVLMLVEPLFVGIIVALTILVVLAAAAFFWPLWQVHSAMVKEKSAHQDKAATDFGLIESRLREAILQNDEKAKEYAEQHASLEIVYSNLKTYPTWPFASRQMVAFVTSQVIPVSTILTAMFELSDIVTGIFT